MSLPHSPDSLELHLCAQANTQKIPLSASLELLPLCNMNCKMCYVRLSPEEMRAQGHMGTAQEWLEIASQLQQAGTLFLLLTGGEPLLHPEFTEIYQGVRRLGMIVNINTNGTLITPHIAHMLGRDLPRRVNVTLYGASDETYAVLCGNPQGFTQCMHALYLLKENNVPVKLNASIGPQNRQELDALFNIARDFDMPLEVNSYMFPCCRNTDTSYDSSRRLSPEQAAACTVAMHRKEQGEQFMAFCKTALKQCDPNLSHRYFTNGISCRAGNSSCWVNWKREMTPCVFMPQPAVPLQGDNFLQAWHKIVKSCQQFKMPTVCCTCSKRPLCQICAAAVYWEEPGENGAPKFLCQYTDETLRLLNNIKIS